MAALRNDKPVFNDNNKFAPSKADEAGIPQHGNDSDDFKAETNTETYYKLPFWTRMGCTPESFKPRVAADKQNQLNQTLKSRHLHMIAIGKLQRT